VVTTSSGNGVLALIPARGGSKSLPRKNIRMLAGRPLIVHSIDSARASRTIDRVIVSTDDEEIAEIARRHGAEVPFLRPAELAADDTTDLPVFQHALQWLEDHESGWRPEIVVQLRPTSPLRRHEDIDRAVELLTERPDADSVRSIAEPLENPYKMWSVTGDQWLEGIIPTDLHEPFNMPRQKLPQVFWQTGAIDAARWATIMELDSMTGHRIAPLVVETLGTVDIDTTMSFELVEWMIRAGHVPWVPAASVSPIGLVGAQRFRRPKVLVCDFDGVFTDNRVWMDQHGEESVVFDRGDGMGINMLRRAGIDMLVLSTEVNPIVGARCRKLGVDCVQGQADKRAALIQWAADRGTDLADIAYVGNDVNDLGCFEAAGLAIAVQDSHLDVLASVDLILSRPGGAGAVREACDLILSFREDTEQD
jgi:YrbI family 3-deoxy-D-manno-octulosonate 8-phosphate phosphatase